MSKSEKPIQELFEEKARAGDGAYAVALALLDVAAAQYATARAVQRLGLGDAATHTGALEALSMEVNKVASAMQAWSRSSDTGA